MIQVQIAAKQQDGETYLVKQRDEGVVVDLDRSPVAFPPFKFQAILARGYWEEAKDVAPDTAAKILAMAKEQLKAHPARMPQDSPIPRSA